jgi:protein-arginine kinase activator protein McsA
MTQKRKKTKRVTDGYTCEACGKKEKNLLGPYRNMCMECYLAWGDMVADMASGWD